ncbi:MAG: hypothetical protein ABW094_09370 [Candidatus Thiodiazotropha sp.]
MQKESAIWLVIRVIGLIFLFFAIYQLYEFPMNVLIVVTYPKESAQSSGLVRLPNLRWGPFFEFILLSTVSLYFLIYGALIYRWLAREGNRSENS